MNKDTNDFYNEDEFNKNNNEDIIKEEMQNKFNFIIDKDNNKKEKTNKEKSKVKDIDIDAIISNIKIEEKSDKEDNIKVEDISFEKDNNKIDINPESLDVKTKEKIDIEKSEDDLQSKVKDIEVDTISDNIKIEETEDNKIDINPEILDTKPNEEETINIEESNDEYQPKDIEVNTISDNIKTEEKDEILDKEENLKMEDNLLEKDNKITNNNPESLDNKSTIKYHGYSYYLTTYGMVLVILIIVFIIISIGYNFSKKETRQYTYDSKVNYQVCLKENNYYKDKCLNENTEYISSITDKINVDFNYTSVYEDIQKRSIKYYIKTSLIIKTDSESAKELYKDENKLTKVKKLNIDKNVGVIAESITIPFDEYNNYATSYKNEYSLTGESILHVSLILKEKDQEKEVSKVSIPLTQLTYNINKTESNNKIETYTVKSNSIIKYLFILLLIITVLAFIYTLYKIVRFIIKTLPKQSKYNKKLNKILNTYDRVIITLENKNTIINDNEVYTVQTFLELLDVRDTIDKPILYYKVNDIKTEFYVQDDNKTYKYVMKESDFEEK